MSQQITIGHLKQGNKISMSKPEANYMWGNGDNTIQIIESLIALINRTTDLYYPKFCSPDNDGVTTIISQYWRICANEETKLY